MATAMRRKAFLIEQLIIVLLITRYYLQALPLKYFSLILVALCIAKYIKEGMRITIIGLFISYGIIVFGQQSDSTLIILVGALVAGACHFLAPISYWFPKPNKIVGFKEDSLQNQLYYVQFYPLDTTKPIKPKIIKWHHTKQISKMLEYVGITNKFVVLLAKFIISYIDHYKLYLGEGTSLKTNTTIVFCHGRGGTPFIYSQFLLRFAEDGYKACSVQHNQVSNTGLVNMSEIKKFREKEVAVRGLQLYQAIIKSEQDNIILIGHSYGCSTTIQAYHGLQQKLKKKVSHIILLDPWFFPLNEYKMKQKIDCPVLILANDDFLLNEDMFVRNEEFVALHNAQYVIWKDAVHLHQTDMGYVSGTMFGSVRNPEKTADFIEYNLKAIDMFIKGQKVEGAFGQLQCPKGYKPAKFTDTGINF